MRSGACESGKRERLPPPLRGSRNGCDQTSAWRREKAAQATGSASAQRERLKAARRTGQKQAWNEDNEALKLSVTEATSRIKEATVRFLKISSLKKGYGGGRGGRVGPESGGIARNKKNTALPIEVTGGGERKW